MSYGKNLHLQKPRRKAMDWKCFTKEEKEKETNRDKGSPNLRDSNLCIYLFLYMQHVHVRERERERGEEWSSRILIIGVTGSSKVNESWAEREREMPRRTLGVFSDSPAKISWHGFFQLYMWSLSVKEITIISSTLALSLNSK